LTRRRNTAPDFGGDETALDCPLLNRTAPGCAGDDFRRSMVSLPVENIWQFMRDNWLSNRVFKSYEDILDHCCFAWNKLIDMPWKIMSIGSRDWAYRS
jgi:hypothetical protein